MSRRSWFKDSSAHQPDKLYAEFGFITTNIGTNPDPTQFFGCGGLTGTDAAGDGSVANTGPSFVSSIVKTANAGEYLVTFVDGYRKVYHADGTVYGPVAGPADGFWLQPCVPANEGQGHETPVTLLVTTMNAAGAPTETLGKRVSITVSLKDGGAGGA